MTENKSAMENVVNWLNAGYPEGVPPKDYFPLLALLKRSLTEDEVVEAAQSILKSINGDTVTEDEIRAAVQGVIDKEPNPPEEIHQSRRDWRRSAGRWRPRRTESRCTARPSALRSRGGRVSFWGSRRSGWVSGT